MNKIAIFSDKGTYDLFFNLPDMVLQEKLHNARGIIIDKNVLNLYSDSFIFPEEKLIILDVSEAMKTPEESLRICKELLELGIKRKENIIALGGGITQDLVTFAASILFRGINWTFVPTTLLAQSDSCIGGKSSLNFSSWKNILGNFYPPSTIIVQEKFLTTLNQDDIRSGIGEILKVHLLSGSDAAEQIIKQFQSFKKNSTMLSEMIFNALSFKNKILEIDPLDTGLRLKMNYGHSFGHALEAATNFSIAHGIAVTIGLDMANFMALRIQRIDNTYFSKIHRLLHMNLEPKDFVSFNFDTFITALRKDKKNSAQLYRFVIPVAKGEVELIDFPMNDETDLLLSDYLENYYKSEV